MLRNDNERALQDYNLKEDRRMKAANNQRAAAMTSAIESTTLTAIYGSFLTEATRALMKQFGNYALFSGFGLLKIVEAGLAWRQAYIDRKARSFVHAAVETLAAAALTTVIVGGFVAAAAFAAVTPIVFTAVGAAKTIYNAGKAIYFAGKAAGTKDTDKKAKYKAIAKSSAVSAGIGAIATAATITVFLLGMTGVGFAVLGVAAGLLAISAAIYYGVKARKAAKQKKQILAQQHEEGFEHHQKPSRNNSTNIIQNELNKNSIKQPTNFNNQAQEEEPVNPSAEIVEQPVSMQTSNHPSDSENEETKLLLQLN